MPSVTALSNMSAQAIANLVANSATISITDLGFIEANKASDSKFETSVNLDQLLSQLIAERGVAGAIAALKVNGGEADAFKLVWDHLDDNYTYYNTNVNDAFIDLGIAYANYLKDGGDAIMSVAKYAADGGDSGSVADRSQTMHDNILGNFDEASIVDKFGADADEILDRIDAAGLGALIGERGNYSDGRDYHGGYEGESQTASQSFDADYFFV